MQTQATARPQQFRTAAFEAHLAKIRQEREACLAVIGDVANGAILRHKSSPRWAFLLPDMTEQGKWRMQRFDEGGFSGHCIFNSHQELVEAAYTDGFREHDPDALDRLQNTPAFQRGNFLTDLLRRINSKEITMTEADQLVARYDAQLH